jgi:hypothetical protein
MRRLAFLVLAVLAASPADAKCHLFSVWRYPWPQRCGAARHLTRPVRHEAPFASETKPPSFRPAIPLPSLARADLDGGAADEPTRARLLLRAVLGAPDAH